MKEIIKMLFNKRLEEINSNNIREDLLSYEEQPNKIDTVYSELFYKAGLHDGLYKNKLYIILWR